jgi:uncharacterized membrane protein
MDTKAIALALVFVGCIIDAIGTLYAMFYVHNAIIAVGLAVVCIGFAVLFLLIFSEMMGQKKDEGIAEE